MTRFKVTKPKPKDSFGAPSDGLTKALVEALGQPIGSDDEMIFDEAKETSFDDSASDKSEGEFC